MAKIKKSFSNALKWAYMGNIGDRAISALVTLILAGFLGPREFGIVSICLIYINFMQMFLDQGLAPALIQKKDLQQEHCDAVFWVNLMTSLVFVGLTVLISGWWSRVNHAPDLARVLSVLSLCIPIEGLSIVQAAIVRREMDFKTLTIRSNLSVFIGGIAGLVLALLGFGVWALVGMQLARDFSGLVLLWGLGHWRPRFEFSWRHFKDLLPFSFHSFVAGLGTFTDMQAGSILLGVLFGPVAVGLYRLAERLMSSVVSIATTSIQAVSLPEFSRLQDNPEELRKSALLCVKLSSTITLPALIGMAVVSEPLMATLGPKWVPATNVLRILCVQGMIFTLSYFTSPLMTALGRTKQVAKLEWSRAIVGMLFILVAGLLLKGAPENWRATGIAFARAIPNALIVTPVYMYLLMHYARVSLRDLLHSLANPVWTSLAVVAAVFLLRLAAMGIWTKPITTLVLETAIGGVAGLSVLIALDRQIRGIALGLASRLGLISTAVT
jgi:O-antigen/teichoic acid export membrane protein